MSLHDVYMNVWVSMIFVTIYEKQIWGPKSKQGDTSNVLQPLKRSQGGEKLEEEVLRNFVNGKSGQKNAGGKKF